MATFTMDSQKNFVPAAGPKGMIDKGLILAIVLLVVVAGLWVTERVLIYLTDKQTAEYKATTAASLSSIKAEDVEAVHDITSRLDAIQKAEGEDININEILAALEKSTIPQTKLTAYEYKNDGAISMSGVVGDYRLLAEQILRYRQEPIFATAEVTSADRNDEGQITFSISVKPEVKEEAVNAPMMPMMAAPTI